jgi:hypothetical protein
VLLACCGFLDGYDKSTELDGNHIQKTLHFKLEFSSLRVPFCGAADLSNAKAVSIHVLSNDYEVFILTTVKFSFTSLSVVWPSFHITRIE